ncbi:unnamed protein product [Brassica oleracea var. botrytis]
MFVNSEKEKVSIIRLTKERIVSSPKQIPETYHSNQKGKMLWNIRSLRACQFQPFFLVSLWSFKSEDHYCRQRHQHITPVQRYNTSAKVFSSKTFALSRYLVVSRSIFLQYKGSSLSDSLAREGRV